MKKELFLQNVGHACTRQFLPPPFQLWYLFLIADPEPDTFWTELLLGIQLNEGSFFEGAGLTPYEKKQNKSWKIGLKEKDA